MWAILKLTDHRTRTFTKVVAGIFIVPWILVVASLPLGLGYGFGLGMGGAFEGGLSDDPISAPLAEAVMAPTLQPTSVPTPAHTGPTTDDYIKNIVVNSDGERTAPSDRTPFWASWEKSEWGEETKWGPGVTYYYKELYPYAGFIVTPSQPHYNAAWEPSEPAGRDFVYEFACQVGEWEGVGCDTGMKLLDLVNADNNYPTEHTINGLSVEASKPGRAFFYPER